MGLSKEQVEKLQNWSKGLWQLLDKNDFDKISAIFENAVDAEVSEHPISFLDKKTTHIVYKPTCGKCGRILTTDEISFCQYNGIYEINPPRCENCGVFFDGLEMKAPNKETVEQILP